MVLHITDPEADRLAREIAAITGGDISDIVIDALREQYERYGDIKRSEAEQEVLLQEVMAIGRHCASLPVYDQRPLEAIMYDENGLPA